MSLRSRLLAGVVTLVAVGLIGFDIATYMALRSHLMRRVDQQLEGAAEPVLNELASAVSLRHGHPSGKTVIPTGTYAQLRRSDGEVFTLSKEGRREESEPPPKLPTDLDVEGGGDERFFTVGSETGTLRYRAMAATVFDGGELVGTFVIALPLRDVNQTLGRLVLIETVGTVAVVVVLGLLSLWVVKIGLRPLDQMTTTAGEIAAGDLSRRVERADDHTEVGRLGLALNQMLGHIERAFAERTESEERLRRFVADASHELRTPLTSIRGYAELFRQGAADRPHDLATAMRRIEDESARMGVLVDDLLLLARLDQGRPLEHASVDLVALASDAVDDARAVTPDRMVTFETNGPAVVTGDEARLRQVAANLLVNARVHTPEGTPVHVRVRTTADLVVLEVTDEGPGLMPEEAERIFERFYRADPSRTRTSGGSGLGLSIVAAIAEAHGGRATVDSGPGRGTTFRVELPENGLSPSYTEPSQRPPRAITDQKDQNE